MPRRIDHRAVRSGSIFIALSLCCAAAVAERVAVGSFSSQGLDDWRHHSFSGSTHYRLVDAGSGDVVRAQSKGAASALYREVYVDLRRTPWLHWRWKVDRNGTIPNVDERIRSGDDYAARIYVVTRTGPLPWQTRAVNYVWSNNQPAGQRWPSAVTDSSLMIAVRSGNAQTGEWLEERRNVREDFARFLGNGIDSIELIALMSDSDQTGASVAAEYGDIFFSSN